MWGFGASAAKSETKKDVSVAATNGIKASASSSPASLLLRIFLAPTLQTCEGEPAAARRIRRASSADVFTRERELNDTLRKTQVEVKLLKRQKEDLDMVMSSVARRLRVCVEDLERLDAYHRNVSHGRIIAALVLSILTVLFSGWGIPSTTLSLISIVFLLAWPGRWSKVETFREQGQLMQSIRILQNANSRDSAVDVPPIARSSTPVGGRKRSSSVDGGSALEALSAGGGNSNLTLMMLKKFANPIPIIDLAGYRFNFLANAGLDASEWISSLSSERKASLFKAKSLIETSFELDVNNSSGATLSAALGKGDQRAPLDDLTTYLFLVSESYNIQSTVFRVRNALKWRATSRFDAFLASVQWNLIRRGYALRPLMFGGFDKHNRPVILENLAAFINNDQAWRGLSLREWERVTAFHMAEITHYCRLASMQMRKPCSTFVYIADLKDVRALQAIHMLQFFRIVAETQRHFPLTREIVFVNVPRWISLVYKAIVRVYDMARPDNVTLLPDDGRAFLIKLLGPDAVPRDWGGKNAVTVLSCPLVVDEHFDSCFPLGIQSS